MKSDLTGDSSNSADDVILRLVQSSCNDPNNTSLVAAASSGIKKTLELACKSEVGILPTTVAALLNYVWKYWDFLVDKVCYDCSDILRLIIEHHQQSCGVCREAISGSKLNECKWIVDLTRDLFTSQSLCKVRFKSIITLYSLQTQLISTIIDDDFIQQIYSLMGNVTLSTVLSELICFDLEVRKSEAHWNFHIQNIGSLFSKGRALLTSLLERLLPRIMQNPLLKNDFVDRLTLDIKERIVDRPIHHCYCCCDCCASFLIGYLSLVKFLIFSRTNNAWRDFIREEYMIFSLLHLDIQVRVIAWGLLCEHPKRTLPISSEDCDFALTFLESNMTEQEPANRQKIIASFKKLLIRLCDVAECSKKSEIENQKSLVDVYANFVNLVMKMTLNSLDEGANFSRRIMVLNLIGTIFKDGVLNVDRKETLWNQARPDRLLDEEARKLLLGCLDDSFQLCQKEALHLLCKLNFCDNFNLDEFISSTEAMINSVRTHNNLSSGYRLRYIAFLKPSYIVSLLERLINNVFTTVRKIREVGLIEIITAPLHPTMNAIALLLDSGPDIPSELWSTQILKMCLEVAKLVRPVVHNLSPEGYVPEECLHEYGEKAADFSQKLVVCCWRAHKQSSSILATSASQANFLSLFKIDEICSIFDFYWMELTECRHCGAFESAVSGFEILCQRLWTKRVEGVPYPGDFLQNILDIVDGKADLDKLCSTRRSAGLPFLITSICATDPTESALNMAMSSLLNFQDKTEFSRNHSLNVLRSLFSHSVLGEKVLKYVEVGCLLGIKGCAAPSWNERNASAQLVAALRCRLFGVSRSAKVELHVDKRNQRSSYEFFSLYPTLYPFLMERLELYTAQDEFGLYPALIFLSHLIPSTNTANLYPLAPFVPRVLKLLLTLRSEKLRKLSVAVFVTITTYDDIIWTLEKLLVVSESDRSQNALDGLFNLLLTLADDGVSYSNNEIKILIGGILSNFHKHSKYDTWSDYVLSQFLALCKTFEFEEPLDKLLYDNRKLIGMPLILRPLADHFVTKKTCLNIDLLEPLKLEIYERLWDINPIDESWRDFINNTMVELNREGKLLNTPSLLQKMLRGIVGNDFDNLDKSRCEALRELSNTFFATMDEFEYSIEILSLMRELRMALNDWKMSDDDVQWLELMAVEEKSEVCEMLLDIGKRLLKKTHDVDLLPLFAKLLQNIDVNIREKASKLLSPQITNLESMNPSICWHLLAMKYPEILLIVKKSVITLDDDVLAGQEKLFDDCDSNPYAEPRLFTHFSSIDKLLERLESISS